MTGGPRPDERHGAAATLLRRIRQRFREGRDALPADRRRRWWRIIGIGAIATFALMAVLRVAAEALEPGLLSRERGFLLFLGTDTPLRFPTAVFLQTFGSDITLAILVAATAGIAAWIRRPITSLSIVLAAIVPDLVVRFGWLIWDRARPDILHQGIASPGFHAFPSGHTAKTIAVYGLLTTLWLRASRNIAERIVAVAAFLFIAAVVPLGRMAMGVHWPTDVIGGAIIGAFWLAVLVFALRLEGSRDSQRAGLELSRSPSSPPDRSP